MEIFIHTFHHSAQTVNIQAVGILESRTPKYPASHYVCFCKEYPRPRNNAIFLAGHNVLPTNIFTGHMKFWQDMIHTVKYIFPSNGIFTNFIHKIRFTCKIRYIWESGCLSNPVGTSWALRGHFLVLMLEIKPVGIGAQEKLCCHFWKLPYVRL